MSDMLAESQEAPQKVGEFLSADAEVYARLGERLRGLNPSVVATVARGSSDHAATYASYLFPLTTGRVVASVPPSLTTVLKAPLNLRNQFLLAISQSGSSPDILRTVESIGASGAVTAGLVNDRNSPIAKASEFLLDQHAGVEKGLAATKTVLCTKTAIARLAAEWSQDSELLTGLKNLPEKLRTAAMIGLKLDENLLQGVSNVYVLSRGLGSGAAAEVSLKIKETCGLHAEAFSSAEVRHGPREIVNNKFAVIALALPGSGQDDVVSISKELRDQGAKLILVGTKDLNPTFELPEIKEARLYPLLALQLLYPWFARVSKAMGRNPDQPERLKSKVIHTI